jgi:hypothetical protein
MGFFNKVGKFYDNGEIARSRSTGNYQYVIQNICQKKYNSGNIQQVKDLFYEEMKYHGKLSRPVLLSISKHRTDFLYLLFIASLELSIYLYGLINTAEFSNYVEQKDVLRKLGPAHDSFVYLMSVYGLLESSSADIPLEVLKSLQRLITKEKEVLTMLEGVNKNET